MQIFNPVISAAPSGAPPTLRAHIVRMLKADILSGKYRPGERLNESRIARELNISRIPVREALSQLQEQGLVMNRERRGMFVTHLGEDEVQQINSLRIVLETEAMRLARARMTPARLAELNELLEQLEHWDGASLMDAAALDLEFHRRIWETSGNPYLVRALESLATPLFAHKALEHVSLEIRRWRLNHHRALLEAIVGDADPQAAMLDHLRMAYGDPDRYSSLVVR